MFHVLILDDDPLVCAMITDVLDEKGLTAASAHTPVEALDILRSPGARVLVVDKHLGPDTTIDGFAAAAEAMRLYPSLSAVYISSDIPGLLQRGGTSPRERHIPKPFLLNELTEAVQDLLLDGDPSRRRTASRLSPR